MEMTCDSARQLATADQIATSLVLDPYLGIVTHKMDVHYKHVESPCLKNVITSFIRSTDYEKTYSFYRNYLIENKVEFEDYEDLLRTLIYSYLKLIDPVNGVTIETCFSYSHENYKGAKLVSRKKWKRNDILDNVVAFVAPLTDEDRANFITDQNDFSVVTFDKCKNKSLLLLGPLSFVNHSCKPNSRYNFVRNRQPGLAAITAIEPREELTAFYSANFFGPKNCECECPVCKQKPISGRTFTRAGRIVALSKSIAHKNLSPGHSETVLNYLQGSTQTFDNFTLLEQPSTPPKDSHSKVQNFIITPVKVRHHHELETQMTPVNVLSSKRPRKLFDSFAPESGEEANEALTGNQQCITTVGESISSDSQCDAALESIIVGESMSSDSRNVAALESIIDQGNVVIRRQSVPLLSDLNSHASMESVDDTVEQDEDVVTSRKSVLASDFDNATSLECIDDCDSEEDEIVVARRKTVPLSSDSEYDASVESVGDSIFEDDEIVVAPRKSSPLSSNSESEASLESVGNGISEQNENVLARKRNVPLESHLSKWTQEYKKRVILKPNTLLSSALQNLDVDKTTAPRDCEICNDNKNKGNVKVNVLPKMKGKSKRQCCVFCKKLVTQLPRHLRKHHGTEQAVVAALSFQPNTKGRLDALKALRITGNFKHNSDVIMHGDGELIVKKRPQLRHDSTVFLPCPNCGQYMRDKYLHRHIKSCSDELPQKRGSVITAATLLKPVNERASEDLRRRVLSRMVRDEISEAVKSDNLICKFGTSLCEKFSSDFERHQKNNISQRLRQLGRLLLVLREQNKHISTLSDVFVPTNFDPLVKATKSLAVVENGKFTVASVGLKIGHSISSCIKILRGDFIRSENNTDLNRLDHFASLFDSEWAGAIANKALKSLEENKYNKEILLPIADDIRKLTNFIIVREESLVQSLIRDKDYGTYLQLNKTILCRLILFNRKRVGDVDKFRVQQFENRVNEANPDILSALSEVERKLASTFTHVEVRGKMGRRVPLLIPIATGHSLKCLLRNRSNMGIPDDNPYVFANRTDEGFIRGNDAMRSVTSLCELKFPERITSTKCRKHVATMSQIMSLRPHEMEGLANFMGHDYEVHKNFYRLPDSCLHLAKFSKLLLAVENGDVTKYKGKNLDDLDIDNIEYQSQESDDCDEEFVEPVETTKRKISRGRKWSQEEVDAVKKHFSSYLSGSRPALPSKQECLDVLAKEPCLRNRSWTLIKYFVKNHRK